uniref:Putative salivary secreted protein n=1 Tax=Ornithodoros parkeri TaxID=140564 RepID=A6N9V0_ORNPR|nr:putative salivary secreted protein [Ornithodoros parkeri]
MTQPSVQALLLLSLFLPPAMSRTTTVRGPPPSLLSQDLDWDTSSELGRRSQSIEQVGVDECPSNAIVRETCQVCVKIVRDVRDLPCVLQEQTQRATMVRIMARLWT